MKKRFIIGVVVVGGLALSALPAMAAQGDITGNGAPSGPHYNLNLIGYAKGETVKNDGGNTGAGNVIHVPLSGHCRIGLTELASFDVLDNNCTDDGLAQFGLPDPAPGAENFTSGYSVYARAVTPHGDATMASCFTDTTGTWCNAGVVLAKSLNDGKFTNVSKTLLTVCVEGQNEPLFDDSLKDNFWDYANNGLRNAQLRFYDGIPTDLSGSCTAVAPN